MGWLTRRSPITAIGRLDAVGTAMHEEVHMTSKYLLYTAYPDTAVPGCWYPEDVQCYTSLRDAMGQAENMLRLGSAPARIAVYQLVEVIKDGELEENQNEE